MRGVGLSIVIVIFSVACYQRPVVPSIGARELADLSVLDSNVDYVAQVKAALQQQSDESPTAEQIVGVLNGLIANLYQEGDYRNALDVAQQTHPFAHAQLGPEHPDTLASVNNLAILYQAQGRYGEAEPLFQRALGAREKVLGPEHPNTLISINNLALIYQAQGRYGEAEPLYQRALAASDKVLGPEHPQTLASVNNLAELYRVQGRYGEAEPLHQRALGASEKVLGPEHPQTLASVNNLAALYETQGRYGEAEPLYQRALAGREKVLGPEHPDTTTTQLSYAVNQVNLKKHQDALKQLSRLEPRLLKLAALRLRHTRQEHLRRRFLFAQSIYQDVVLTLALNQDKPEYRQLTGRVILRWKHIQGDEESFIARLVRSRGASVEVKSLAADIARLRGDLTNLINQANAPPNLQLRKLNELETKEIRLARLSLEFKRHLEVRRANLHDVSSGLPRDAVLLEFRRYWPFDFHQGRSQAPRFIALLLDARGELSLYDLAEVAEVEASWRALRSGYTKETAVTLYQQLFGKLEAELKRYKTLYVAPDHFLNLIAFGRLVTSEGRYWVERDQVIRQVRSGRHLIKGYESDLDKPRGMLAIGGVSYDDFSEASAKFSQPSNEMPKDDKRIADTSAAKPELNRFTRLEQTGPEAVEVAHRYWDDWGTEPQIWKGFDATEGRLKALDKVPKVLHLATHGFYLSNNSSLIDRPMVLSGLALAGANLGREGRIGPDGEDGILYALEALNLNLDDAELVSLSACDTGVGTLDYSEGVYGLVRAFHIAGARNVLMSLWRLGDSDAREFMKRFYSHWLNGSKPKDLAITLKETQLSFIHESNPRLRDPNVWAPYVLVESR